mmetsp:Transcript_35498/g.85649  ORF Transcript_35498/g.85649 Transcript_35498/m.85649 type:complete len:225 (-) Transcript_35498:140-814(-)
MHQSMLRQPSRQPRALLEDALGLLGAHPVRVQLIQWHAPDESHGDDVSILTHRPGRRVSHLVQRLHERVFLEGRRSRQEQPRVGNRPTLPAPFPILGSGVHHEVIALLFHVPKRRPAEPVEFEHDLRVSGRDGEVDVALLPGADLVADAGDDAAGLEVVQRQDVVSRIRQAVPVVAAALIVAQQLVAQQARDNLVGAAVAEVGYRVDQGDWHEGVIFHARFDRR